ncbi:MAG: hypothetical protein WDN46_15795 [Methylocella sp.]
MAKKAQATQVDIDALKRELSSINELIDGAQMICATGGMHETDCASKVLLMTSDRLYDAREKLDKFLAGLIRERAVA